MHHLDSWIKRDQLDVTCFFISLFKAQHVSDVNTSILRSLRLICWVISWVVLLWFDVCWCYVVVWLGWCGIRRQAEVLVSFWEDGGQIYLKVSFLLGLWDVKIRTEHLQTLRSLLRLKLLCRGFILSQCFGNLVCFHLSVERGSVQVCELGAR